MTRRGHTPLTQKRGAPSWTPTPSRRERFPDWRATIPGGEPRNPLGACALYLSWQRYRIHDARRIGRPSSGGCVGLHNGHITQLFDLVPVGTPVRIV